MTYKDIGTALLDFAMPRLCVVCRGHLLLRERFICTNCLADLPLTHFWSRTHNPMADRFNERIQETLDSAPGVEDAGGGLGSRGGEGACAGEAMHGDLPTSASVDAGGGLGSRGGEDACAGEAMHGDLPTCASVDAGGGLGSRGGLAMEPYAYAAALFFYNSESLYKRIPQHLKYQAGLASGRYFSAMLGRALASEPAFSDVDVVIPVPLHWTRRWKRGYNQAEVIAQELASALGAQCCPQWLKRIRRTSTQTRVSVAAKSANVSGAFRVPRRLSAAINQASTSGIGGASPQPAVSGAASQNSSSVPSAMPRHVLLVDDTFTTGATLNACRVALRAVLPPSVRISVATLAFVSA